MARKGRETIQRTAKALLFVKATHARIRYATNTRDLFNYGESSRSCMGAGEEEGGLGVDHVIMKLSSFGVRGQEPLS